MREYGRLHVSFWTSKTIRSLGDDGRTLAAYLLTCQHNTIIGAFRLPAAYACDDIGWELERFKKAFKALEEHGFAVYCRETQWVWIVKFLEWNPPENPNQKTGVKNALKTLPTCCFSERLAKALGTLGKQGEGTGEGEGTEKGKGSKHALDPSVAQMLMEAQVDSVVVADFTEVRRAHGAPLTVTALKGLQREAKKADMTLQAALEMACERGWRGFKAEWVKTKDKAGSDDHFLGAL